MKLKGQQKKVYDLLAQRPNIGITSQQLRDLTHIVDIPKVISILIDKGIEIESKPEHLGQSLIKRYYLKTGKPRIIRYEFDNENNIAYPIYESEVD